jgi:hypothetical protein
MPILPLRRGEGYPTQAISGMMRAAFRQRQSLFRALQVDGVRLLSL